MSDIFVLSRDEFKEIFINPLEKLFGYKVYWNSKKVQDIGLELLSSSTNGCSYISKSDAPIILKYRKSNLNMLTTLIHEYGHSCLHNINNKQGYILPENIKELEAEILSKEVLDLLGLKYQRALNYIILLEKCSDKEMNFWQTSNRKNQIHDLAKQIANVLTSRLALVNNLESSNIYRYKPYKYTITCPICGQTWKYKKASKIIKNNAKGSYCSKCGKDETLDKLIVEKLQQAL